MVTEGALQVRLLGRPRITAADGERTLAGRKPWALLALLLLSDRPLTRRELAERLFEDAADPLGALRWTLLQLRRALAPEARVTESPAGLAVAGSLESDVGRLLAGDVPTEGVASLPTAPLLDGIELERAPAFDGWLLLQRARFRSAVREAFLAAALYAARTDLPRALEMAGRALELDPYDDRAHEMLVDLHLAGGDRHSAERQVRHVEKLYHAELGVDAPATISRPLERAAAPPARSPVDRRISSRTTLEAARARLAAGEYDAAIDSAARAVRDAALAGDGELEARALATLAATLIHSVRGRDQEAIGLLDRGLRLATAGGRSGLVAEIERERGYLGFLRAEYGSAEVALNRAIRVAGSDGGTEPARARTLLGAVASDRGDFEAAERDLRLAMAMLEAGGDRWLAFARSFLARVLLRTGRADVALEQAESSVAEARLAGWLSLVPWPMVLVGEAALELGDRAHAADVFATAYSLACEIGDPCWQAFALRGLALVARQEGQEADARANLLAALEQTRSLPDIYRWSEALVLTDLVVTEQGRDELRVREALALTTRAPMRDLAETVRHATARS